MEAEERLSMAHRLDKTNQNLTVQPSVAQVDTLKPLVVSNEFIERLDDVPRMVKLLLFRFDHFLALVDGILAFFNVVIES